MHYAIALAHKISSFPMAALFITAYSEFHYGTREQCTAAVSTVLLNIIETAIKEYDAICISNEPTNHTHQLQHKNMEKTVVMSCSLQFKNFGDVQGFMKKMYPGSV
ncbi:MAG: hypothetical protein IJ272_05050 [Clostridia bacterium]|nr:hypothetical protein [Clostridia bacterium]